MDILKLEIHASHACNFTCESCSHFSNNAHKGILTPEDADIQMGFWSHRLNPKIFCVLGGEPFLNPRIEDFLKVTRKHWKNCIELVTNGFLIPKFPKIGKLIDELGINMIITRHHDNEEYIIKLNQVLEFLDTNKIRFTMRIPQGWTRRYKGYGSDVLPYEDNNPKASWEICNCKYCPQILNGKIYKCPLIAYLTLQKARWPDISEKWNKYLAYKPLEHTATDEEIAEFFSRKEESICEMCPAKIEHFEKPSPLITVNELISRLKSKA